MTNDAVDPDDDRRIDPPPRASIEPSAAQADLPFEHYAERLTPSLVRIAWTLLRDWQLAHDAAQEALLLFAERISEISPESRDGWLVKTVQFKARSIRRAAQRQQNLIGKLKNNHLVGVTEDASTTAQRCETIAQLRSMIEQLPAQQREVVLLRMRSELTFAEIADLLNCPTATVLSRMRLAIEKLAKRFNADENEATDR